MSKLLNIKLYGAERCHKIQYYKTFLAKRGLEFEFLDVEINNAHADQLRALYENNKLNFPTLILGTKKLRNPTDDELIKWILSSG